MASNSIRISADLFEQAARQGERLTRSAAQQVEHWARLGAAVEASGLSVPQLVELIQSGDPAAAAGAGTADVTSPLGVSSPVLAREIVDDVVQGVVQDVVQDVVRDVLQEPEAALWAAKRARQRRDIESVESGRAEPEDMSWFSGGRARRARSTGTPF